MDDPRGRQARFNAESRGQWDGFSAHRRKVSSLLAAGPIPGRRRLCVLGAGNANDLDLPALLATFGEVHLVDLDAEALALGAGRQGVSGNPGLHLHGGIDLTGMLDAMAGWSPLAAIPDAELVALVEWPARRVAMALPAPFDRVASTCLLSQIAGNAFTAIGDRHPRFAEVVRAIRLGHLRLLTRLAAPVGEVVLISDVVSSDHRPVLAEVEESALPALLARLSREGGLIHGVNPADLRADFRNDPILARSVSGLVEHPPWRWRLYDRTYLVHALSCRVNAGTFGDR